MRTLACFAVACASSTHAQDPRQPTNAPSLPAKLAAKHLPNAWRVHSKVVSGGAPNGDEAFRELAELGIRTIISVDGAKPDVERAKKFGLRYVHLPHGYDGISETRSRELAKAVRDLPGPIYLHCHHGKHRSPAAAAVACVGAGFIDPVDAEPILESVGTSHSYRGLFQAARQSKRIDTRLLDVLKVDFSAQAKIPPLAEAMVALEHTHDRLKLIAAANWTAPPHHPDLEPVHEALLLREHFTEMLRADDSRRRPESFLQMLRDSERESRRLEVGLRAWKPAVTPRPPELLTTSLQRVTEQCRACHAQFRDVPLGEK